MSDVITNRDVAELLRSLGRESNAATVEHFETPAPPVAWTAEIDSMQAEIDTLRGQLSDLEALLCKRCKTKWEKS